MSLYKLFFSDRMGWEMVSLLLRCSWMNSDVVAHTGWMYTIIACIMAISGVLIVVVMHKGAQWRHLAEERELEASTREEKI